MSSETEVSALRKPGDLIFSLDNEIVSVQLRTGQEVVPGDVVGIDSSNLWVKSDGTNIKASDGYGVVIHEGLDDSDNSDAATAAGLIQIATGNAYVAIETGAIVKPHRKVKTNSSGKIIESHINSTSTTVAHIATYLNETIGKCYGNPGEQTIQTSVASGGTAVVRLGLD